MVRRQSQRRSRTCGLFRLLPSLLLVAACGGDILDLPPPPEAADWSAASPVWGTFRGNARHTGHVAATLDYRTFRELWGAAPFGAVGIGSVAIGDGRVFVASSGPNLHALAALDLATGATQWQRDFGGIHNVNPPAYAEGSVYVQTGGQDDSFLRAFDAASGALRFQVPYVNQWWQFYAPVVVDSTVYAPGGYFGGVYAFSTRDGSQRWFSDVTDYDLTTPAVHDGTVYAYPRVDRPVATALDGVTGSTAFEVPDPGFSQTPWSLGGALVVGDERMLVIQNNRLVGFDLAGRRQDWQIRDGFVGTPVVAHGIVYANRYWWVEARRERDGELVWTWSPPDDLAGGHLLATDNLLFVSTFLRTYALHGSSGRPVWSTEATGSLALTGEGVLIIAAEPGTITAFRVR